MAPPQLGLSYDGVFDFLDYCDNQMVKVFDVAQQSECLLTNFQWVGGRKTFYHLVTLEIEPLTVLTFVDTSVAIDAPCLDVMPWDLVELGACTGAMSVGPQFTGARPRASLDVNRLACDHLASNNHGCVHHADLLDTKPKLHVISMLAWAPFLMSLCLGSLVSPIRLRGCSCIKLIHVPWSFGPDFGPFSSCRLVLVSWSVSLGLLPIQTFMLVSLLSHRSAVGESMKLF